MEEPVHNPPPPPPHKDMAVGSPGPDKGKIIVVTALITATVTFLVTSVIWISAGIAIYAYQTADPPPFTIDVEAPETVELGDRTVVVVEITNHSQETATLGSVDLYGTLLDGFRIKSVEPKPDSQTKAFGIHTFYSKQKLGPSESISFTFTLEAAETGYWSGSIDACTPFENFTSEWLEIEVVEELESEKLEATD